MLKYFAVLITLGLTLLLTGCAPPIYGVARSTWNCMTPEQQQEAMIKYYQYMALGCSNNCHCKGFKHHPYAYNIYGDGLDTLCSNSHAKSMAYHDKRAYRQDLRHEPQHYYHRRYHHAPQEKLPPENYHHSHNNKHNSKKLTQQAATSKVAETSKRTKLAQAAKTVPTAQTSKSMTHNTKKAIKQHVATKQSDLHKQVTIAKKQHKSVSAKTKTNNTTTAAEVITTNASKVAKKT